jgi:chromosome segregation ATPase
MLRSEYNHMHLAAERTFMSSEQEAAAKWGMYEKYKQLTAKQAAVKYKMKEWGDTMSPLADELRRLSTDSFRVIQANANHLPTKEQIMAAMSELDTLKNDIHQLKHQLKDAGMDLNVLTD